MGLGLAEQVQRQLGAVKQGAGDDRGLPPATQARELLDVKSEQDYCWMWTTKTSSPTSLTVTLQR